MFLPLAERMVEKMVKEDKIEAEAEVSTRPSSSPQPGCTTAAYPRVHLIAGDLIWASGEKDRLSSGTMLPSHPWKVHSAKMRVDWKSHPHGSVK